MGKLAEHWVEIGAKISKFQKGMTVVQQRMTQIGQKMSAVGKSMTMRVTLPLLAVGTAAVKMGADFDKAMTESLAIMGDLSDAMKKDMRDAALEMSTKTTFAAKDLAEAYFFLASAGMDAAQSIKALPVVAKFAQAGAFDLATATDLLTDAQTAMSLSSKDAAENQRNLLRVSDVLVKANTLANAKVQQFSESLTNMAAASLVNAKKGLEEGVAVLAAFADKGVKGQKAGMKLSMMLNSLDVAARKNKDAWDEHGLSLFDAQGEMRHTGDIIGDLEVLLGAMTTEQKAATLAQLGFNVRTKASILTLMGSSEKIKEWTKNLKVAGGTTEKVADKQMKAFSNQMIVLKNTLVKVGIQIGDILIPIIKDLVDNHIKPAIERFSNLSENTKKTIVKIAGLVAITGPLLLVFGKLLAIIPLIVTQMKIMGFTSKGLRMSLVGVKGVLSRLPAIGMAAFAGWQIGRLIGQIKICGKSIDEHISGALARAIGWLALWSGFVVEAELAAKGTELLAKKQKMLAEASEVSGRQITNLKEAAEILNKRNFELAISTGNVAKEQKLLNEATEISGRKITHLADAAKILEKDYKTTIIQAGLFISKTEMLAKASELSGQKITNMNDAFSILKEHYKKTGDLGSKALNDWAEKATQADKKIAALKEATDKLSGSQERLKKVSQAVADMVKTMTDEIMEATLTEYEYRIWTAKKTYEERKKLLKDEGADKAAFVLLEKVHAEELKGIEEDRTDNAKEQYRARGQAIYAYFEMVKEKYEKFQDFVAKYTAIIQKHTLSEFDYKKAQLDRWKEKETKALEDELGATELFYEAKLELDKAYNEELKQLLDDRKESWLNNLYAIGDAVANLFTQIGALAETNYQNQVNKIDAEYDARKKAIDASMLDDEEKYFATEKLERDMALKKKAIQKKAFESQKRVSLVTAAINIAEAITKALTGAIPPWSFVLAGLAAAAGAIQIATISAQTFPSLQEGGLIPRPMPVMAGHGSRGEIIAQPSKLAEIITREMPRTVFPEPAFAPATIQPIVNIYAQNLDRDTVDRASEMIYSAVERARRRRG